MNLMKVTCCDAAIPNVDHVVHSLYTQSICLSIYQLFVVLLKLS